MKRVVIESRLSGDFVRNQRYARLCAVDCMRRGESPYASHLFFTQMLNDATPEDRKLGMECGFAWAEAADLCAIYEDFGISDGMNEGINRALANKIPYEFRKLPADLMAQVDDVSPVSLRATEGAAT
jgi:hypothetical protein